MPYPRLPSLAALAFGAGLVIAPPGRTAECPTDVAGTCWVTRSVINVSATATAQGRTVTCSARCRAPLSDVLVLNDDGTYQVPGGRALACPSGYSGTVPDEVGTVQQVRGRRLVLRPSNLDELLDFARQCVNPAARVPRLRDFRAWVRPSRDGQRLTGRTTLHGRVGGRIPVSVRVTARSVAVPDGHEPPVPGGPRLRDCGTTIAVRCVF